VLQPLGYNVLYAASGEEALKVAASPQVKIDLLLTDVMLPGIKGQELARQMISTDPGVNILFMSGYLCPSMAYSDQDQRHEAFIQKPFSPKTLLRKIRKLLA